MVEKVQAQVTWLSAKEVGTRIGCDARFVYSQIAKGLLAAYRFGGIWRIRPSDVGAYIESARREAIPPANPDRPRKVGRPRKVLPVVAARATRRPKP
jgi:excisionase family DNA binding protein